MALQLDSYWDSEEVRVEAIALKGPPGTVAIALSGAARGDSWWTVGDRRGELRSHRRLRISASRGNRPVASWPYLKSLPGHGAQPARCRGCALPSPRNTRCGSDRARRLTKCAVGSSGAASGKARQSRRSKAAPCGNVRGVRYDAVPQRSSGRRLTRVRPRRLADQRAAVVVAGAGVWPRRAQIA
jgi:hypothetical protein